MFHVHGEENPFSREVEGDLVLNGGDDVLGLFSRDEEEDDLLFRDDLNAKALGHLAGVLGGGATAVDDGGPACAGGGGGVDDALSGELTMAKMAS